MTLNCKGTLIDLSSPKIMGILNITPDSFYDGGKFKNEKAFLIQAEKMLKEGATFLDVGGYSSRPGAVNISEYEELKRVIPIISLLTNEYPNTHISIDTFRAKVARNALDAGASLVNDISAGSLDNNMMPTIAKYKVPYIMMHLKGTPQTMQNLNQYNNLITDIIYYFTEKIKQAKQLKINDIIIDPGFGFAKNIEQNFELLNQLELLKTLDHPLLVGISRKSMIYKTLKNNPENALNGTTALHSIALIKGAKILRVHDVKEAQECVTLIKNLNNFTKTLI